MSLGWLSGSSLLPSESKKILIDPKANAGLTNEVFNKEQDARRHGALITNRPKLQNLKNCRLNWIKNQKAALDEEKKLLFKSNKNTNGSNDIDLDYDLEKSSKILQEKAKKYNAIMTGQSNAVQSSCLVDFGLKGIDIEQTDARITKYDENIAKLRHKQINEPIGDKLSSQYPCTKDNNEWGLMTLIKQTIFDQIEL